MIKGYTIIINCACAIGLRHFYVSYINKCFRNYLVFSSVKAGLREGSPMDGWRMENLTLL